MNDDIQRKFAVLFCEETKYQMKSKKKIDAMQFDYSLINEHFHEAKKQYFAWTKIFACCFIVKLSFKAKISSFCAQYTVKLNFSSLLSLNQNNITIRIVIPRLI